MQGATELLMRIAAEYHRAGRLAEAETICRRLLGADPNHLEALHFLAVLAGQMGRPDMAVRLLERAIALSPRRADFQGNYGVALQAAGRFDEAVAAHGRAIRLGSSLGGMDYYNLGCACDAAGRVGEAVAAYERAVQLAPDFSGSRNNLGRALLKIGRLEEAMVACLRAVELNPENAEFHNNLGAAWQAASKIDEAIGAFQEAIRLKPDCAEAYSNLGNCHRDNFQPNLAIECYRQAHAYLPDDAAMHSNLVYALHFAPGFGAGELLEESLHWDRRHAQPLKRFIRAHGNDPTPERKLRIGYVSPDFRVHVVGRNLLPLLRRHDRREFEIYAYADVRRTDAMTEEIRGLADHWRETTWRRRCAGTGSTSWWIWPCTWLAIGFRLLRASRPRCRPRISGTAGPPGWRRWIIG
jgi:protein O-GlcNAc transferase